MEKAHFLFSEGGVGGAPFPLCRGRVRGAPFRLSVGGVADTPISHCEGWAEGALIPFLGGGAEGVVVTFSGTWVDGAFSTLGGGWVRGAQREKRARLEGAHSSLCVGTLRGVGEGAPSPLCGSGVEGAYFSISGGRVRVKGNPFSLSEGIGCGAFFFFSSVRVEGALAVPSGCWVGGTLREKRAGLGGAPISSCGGRV